MDAKFSGNSSDGFTYKDGTFRGTSNATQYADGGTQTTDDGRDVIFVRLGGIDTDTVNEISGGWSRIFSLNRRSNISISIVFQLEVAHEFDIMEISEALCSLDGQILRNGAFEYLAQLTGNGFGGSAIRDGFRQVNLNATNVESGNHTLVVGGHLTSKSYDDEVTYIRFDSVKVQVSETIHRNLGTAATSNTKPNIRRRFVRV